MDNTTEQNQPGAGNGADEIRRAEQAIARMEGCVDLEDSSRYSGALRRRRVVRSAKDLLRMVMVYCLMPFSVRQVAAWSTMMDWGSLSKSGMRKRLRQCAGWMGLLIMRVLVAGKLRLPNAGAMRLRLIDASCVSQVGSSTADWRLHLSYDLTRQCIDEVHLSSGKVSETLAHFTFQPGDVCLADRAYGVAHCLGFLFQALAFFVIRVGWHTLRMEDREGQPFTLWTWLRVQSADPAAPPAQAQVWVVTPQGRFPVRLVSQAIPPAAAEEARRRVRAEAKRKHRCLDERSLLAAGFVVLVSNLPTAAWAASDLLALYRFRWQIELVFKRLKGLLCFDQLRATDPQLAQLYLLTKILVALLLGEAAWRLALQSSPAWLDDQRPISVWRLTQLLLEAFRASICGSITFLRIAQHWPLLQRYVCDDPRSRKKQVLPTRFVRWFYAF